MHAGEIGAAELLLSHRLPDRTGRRTGSTPARRTRPRADAGRAGAESKRLRKAVAGVEDFPPDDKTKTRVRWPS
ncbi:hypothetical protein FTUN_5786 [Frigoriglobus tundricola]|uniref:Uncharacterized protein n=1 Tax=Frigoriglobus tundricola TaxID=2774151 RepID=A0A6M5YVZ1_9BACT|nr:hypothetical protein FTUN_5786 [Frigoriglobus tundricola]